MQDIQTHLTLQLCLSFLLAFFAPEFILLDVQVCEIGENVDVNFGNIDETWLEKFDMNFSTLRSHLMQSPVFLTEIPSTSFSHRNIYKHRCLYRAQEP